jgi:hypothetical protein
VRGVDFGDREIGEGEVEVGLEVEERVGSGEWGFCPRRRVVDSLLHVQVFACVDIGEGKALKRLSYLTMIFLPASFVAVRVLLHLFTLLHELTVLSLSWDPEQTTGRLRNADQRTEAGRQLHDSVLRSDGSAVDGVDDMDHHGDRMER